MALEREVAIAEFYRLAERQARPAEDLLPRHLYRYEFDLNEILDLRDTEALAAIGLSMSAIESDDPSLCQSVGEAAFYDGFEGLAAPSATGLGAILAVFPASLKPGSRVEPTTFEIWALPPLQQ
jgi:hypothetical protein